MADVAIIGISCAFPGADSKDEFWQMIKDHKVVTSLDPVTVLNHKIAAEGVLKDAYSFDAPYFNLSPRDAKLTDPQLRKLLEHSVLALYDGNITAHLDRNHIGTFLSVGTNQYFNKSLVNSKYNADENLQYSLTIGNSHHCVATQVAYRLNLQGPAYTLSTACSSSLVAIYQACRSLTNGESHVALAGGACINTPHGEGYEYTPGGVLSESGRCQPFSSESDGTIPSSGVGVLVLKRLEDALADDDKIYAVIKGGAINNDGARKVGYTAPSIEGQSEVIAQALVNSGVDASAVEFIECHGTATALGDSIEIEALSEVYDKPSAGHYALGGVKWNIGHTDAAAGVASVIKVAMSLKNNMVVGSPYLTDYNPELAMECRPFTVPSANQPFSQPQPYAAVSAFGMGGTNCHLIMQAYQGTQPQSLVSAQMGEYVVPISARSESALNALEQTLAHWLDVHPEVRFEDVLGTQTLCRAQEKVRRFHIANDIKTLKNSLRNAEHKIVSTVATPDVVVVVEGQGSDIKGAAGFYYEHVTGFAQYFDSCMQAFANCSGMPDDLSKVALDEAYDKDISAYQTLYAQPILFSIQYALAQLLKSQGVQFNSYIGHSLGEWIAAAIADLWSFDDAVKLIACRAVALQACQGGAMLAVFQEASKLESSLFGTLTIAAINSQSMTVVSGSQDDIASLNHTLNSVGIKCKQLKTNRAFHSPMIASALPALQTALDSVQFNEVGGSVYSNLTGRKLPFRKTCNAQYWLDQIMAPVLAGQSIQAINAKSAVYVDLGVSNTMQNIVFNNTTNVSDKYVKVKGTLNNGGITQLLGQCWSHGIKVNPHIDFQWQKLNMPGYVFDKVEYFQKPSEVFHKQGKQDVAQWLYQDSWAIKPANLTVVDIATPIVGYTNWLQQRDSFIYTGFELANDITPDSLMTFIDELKTLRPEGTMQCYVLYKSSSVPSAESLSQCYGYALSALCNVIAQESPSMSFKLLSYSTDRQQLLTSELSKVNVQSNALHFDGRHLWHKVYAPLRAVDEPYTLPQQGFVMITGGLGKVGLALAQYLIEQTQLDVVLLGRKSTGLPHIKLAALDDSLIENIENKHAFTMLKDCERVSYACACVTNEPLWHDLIDNISAQSGPLKGIIHSAAYTDSKGLLPVLSTDAENTQKHFSAKIYGLTTLDNLCQKYQPEFCLLMSSISTVLGGVGLGTYAFVNQYMNEFSTFKASTTGTRWLSVSWDGWDLHDNPELSKEIKALAINNLDCTDIFNHVFQLMNERHVIVSTHDLQTRIEQWVTTGISTRASAQNHELHHIEEVAKQAFITCLEIEKVDLNSNFFDLGGESVMFTSLIAKIRDKLDLSLPLHEFINNPTLHNVIEILKTEAGLTGLSTKQVSEQLTEIFQELLDLPMVNQNDNFFDVGGDSLIFTQLAKRIRDQLGFQLPLHKFIDNPTISHLVELICKDASHSTTDDVYDDLVLPASLQPLALADNTQKVFLVTGASGLLGTNLVTTLLARDEVTKVIALVRGIDHEHAYKRVTSQLQRYAPGQSQDKLSVLCGDVAEPLLGLDSNEYQTLCESVTDILHNAAQVNHILDYRSLKPTNTFSVITLLEMASTHQHKHLHFVSTLACAFELNDTHRYTEHLPTLAIKPASGANGYARSKWAAEVLLEQAVHREYSVNVIRPSSIMGDSAKGTFNPHSDHLWLFVKGCLQLGSYPDVENEINLTPVDFMATLIVTICLCNENKVYNVPTPHVARMTDIFSLLKTRGYQLEGVPYQHWIEHELSKVDQSNALYPILPYYAQQTHRDDLAHDYRNVVVDNTATLTRSLNLAFPEPKDFMSNLVEFLENDQFFAS
ncbi:thioester reductase domain-containing protein [Xenorhabdus sp. SGI240]|uniref:thioester reductase domain-containing protein n=1 Tax=Xenorhabdus sp. SGI240 TaxID=3158262 RepID=UPI0032B74CFE